MKKITLLILITLAVTTLTACSNKWNNQDPNMPAEVKQKFEETLNKHLTTLKETPTDIDAQFEVAYMYDQLGNYRNAVKYYKEVLESDPVHFPALNNIAAIYETVEEYDSAAEYIKRLYSAYPDNTEAIRDTVRILLKADDPDGATQALENFANLYLGENGSPELTTLISDLFASIYSYNQEHEK